jgi:hypothetical protein
MEADQDWCLSCGTAAPGRLGERPGWRAATTVVGLTLLLVLGAVGAGYAALTGDANRQAAAPAPPSAAPQTQAQVAPPATQSTPTQSTPTQSTPTQSTPSKSSTLPKVHAPTTGSTKGAPVTPVTPPSSSGTSTGTGTGSTSTGTGTGTTPTGTGTGTGTTTTPADTGPKPIELKEDAGSAYDPYKRAKASGDVKRALDGDASTSWYVDPNDPAQIGVGYAVNLGKLQGIREIQLQTSTPGFRMEVYATDEAQPPPDILDTRWSHITNVSNVGAKDDGKQKIVLGAGTTKYRNLLLWFTQPPTAGPRLRLTELALLG